MKQVTLENIDQFSDQEVFDFVCTKLIEQGQPAGSFKPYTGFECRYRIERNDKVLKCAVGHLISDELYASGLIKENSGIRWQDSFISKHPISDQKLALLENLQMVHDSITFKRASAWIPHFIEEARKVAIFFNLNQTVLNTQS